MFNQKHFVVFLIGIVTFEFTITSVHGGGGNAPPESSGGSNFQIGYIDPTVSTGDYTTIAPNVIIHAGCCIGDYCHISESNLIEHNSIFGDHVNINKSNVFRPGVILGDYVKIGKSNVFRTNSKIEDYANIGKKNLIQENVKIQDYFTLGEDNKIGTACKIGDNVEIENSVIIGNDVTMNDYSRVDNHTEVLDGTIFDMYSIIGSGVKIQSKVYIGVYSKINDNAQIKERAVVHRNVEIKQGTTIQKGEVVIATPSTLELFQQCKKLDGIPRDINSSFLESMNAQFAELHAHCEHTNDPTDLKKMPLIKSLYLMLYSDVQRFNSIHQQVLSGSISSPELDLLVNEFHFRPDGRGARDVLQQDIKKKFLQLLAIELDSQRCYRAENDNFCLMIKQLQSNERKLTCANRKKSDNNDNNINISSGSNQISINIRGNSNRVSSFCACVHGSGNFHFD